MKDNVLKIYEILKKYYGHQKTALSFKSPFELLVAVILSAQCTDKRVNQITPELFKKYPDAGKMAKAYIADLEGLIRSAGFYKNKAKNIKGASEAIMKEYGGKVPSTMKELLVLPGVARKTANVVLYSAYGVIEGVAVDTHVKRLSQRLGFSKNKTPEKIEKDLMAIFPKEEWGEITFILITHGRNICKSKSPQCPKCPVNDLCPSAAVSGKKS